MNLNILLGGMGGYYALTGIWPLLHMKSFEAVTGKKYDHWLVKTVSLMILGSGLVFLYGAKKPVIREEVWLLALLNAIGLAAIDFIYPLKKRIRRVYLLDGCIQLVLIALLLWFK